jgi:phenolic acid decarboxylase
MINKIRLTTGIMFLVAFMGFLFLWIGLFSEKEYKYYIKIPHSIDYQTNSYVLNGNCITFKDIHNNPITVCGNYTIITNKK